MKNKGWKGGREVEKEGRKEETKEVRKVGRPIKKWAKI
jgi:hypothetical protein